MSKLSRYTQLLFGTGAGTNAMAEFGSLFASYPTVPTRYSGSTITPALVQALSNYITGWTGAAIGGNSPAIEDMNALCYLFAYQLAYQFQEGIPEWDSATTYYKGSYVNSSGVLYVSLIDSNLNNAVTNTSDWGIVGGRSMVSSSCGSFATTSASLTNITNLSVTFPSIGKPLRIYIQPDGTTNGAGWGGAVVDSTIVLEAINVTVALLKDSSVVAEWTYQTLFNIGSTGGVVRYVSQLAPLILWLDQAPTVGNHTYTLQMKSASPNQGLMSNFVLVVEEA